MTSNDLDLHKHSPSSNKDKTKAYKDKPLVKIAFTFYVVKLTRAEPHTQNFKIYRAGMQIFSPQVFFAGKNS